MIKALFTVINRVIGNGPNTVFNQKYCKLAKSIACIRAHLHEDHKEPTMCKLLVTGDPHFVGIMDTVKEGIGGCSGQEGGMCPANFPSRIATGCPRPSVHGGQPQQANHKFRFGNIGPPIMLACNGGGSSIVSNVNMLV